MTQASTSWAASCGWMKRAGRAHSTSSGPACGLGAGAVLKRSIFQRGPRPFRFSGAPATPQLLLLLHKGTRRFPGPSSLPGIWGTSRVLAWTPHEGAPPPSQEESSLCTSGRRRGRGGGVDLEMRWNQFMAFFPQHPPCKRRYCNSKFVPCSPCVMN